MYARLLVLVTLITGCGATVAGTVFVDRNGDHIRQAGEPGVPGVVVALDRGGFVTTGSDGSYHIDALTPGAIVWARVPEGFRPGPAWTAVTSTPQVIDIALTPLADAEATRPMTFVVAADSHMPGDDSNAWTGGDLADAINQATSLPQPPRFFTIVGDVTQGGTGAEYDRVATALDELGVPWVPVPGNHDWYDGGAAYRAHLGPDNYSFDAGGIHVVVWDTNLASEDQIAFFAADLARVAHGTPIVGLGHASPPDDVADQLAELGVDYLFTGHWHANRRVARRGLVEWGTQTFIMGGIDQSPAGYRIVTFENGVPTIEHRERLLEPHLELVSPHPGSCAPAELAIVAAAALDASRPTVTARLDCGPELRLASTGGWTFRAQASALAPGAHTLELHATSPAGRSLTRTVGFDVCQVPGAPVALAGDAPWAQVGGGPAHEGALAAAIAPPLQVAWVATVGGSLSLGTPVVSGDTVIVAQTDRAAGDAGGLVALDLATGAERWRYRTPYPTTGSPAIAGDTVIVTLGDGEIHAVGLADGAHRWTANVSAGLPSLASSLWAAPTIAGGLVYVGVSGRFAAFDLATGATVWHHELGPAYPWLGSRASPAIDGDTVLATFDRDSGLRAYAAATGEPRWTVESGLTAAMNGSPVIAAGIAYVGSATGDLTAIDVATGAVRWSHLLTPNGFDWGYSATAAPATANGRVFAPTQWDDLVALSATTGAELWRASTPRGPLELAHYRSAQAGYGASPLVTGDLVWVGRPDGRLVALSAADGHELWSTALGAPIVSTPAPAGGGLVVAGYDGAVRALVPATARPLRTVETCAPLLPRAEVAVVQPTGGGGCAAGGANGGGAIVLIAGALAVGARRRRVRILG